MTSECSERSRQRRAAVSGRHKLRLTFTDLTVAATVTRQLEFRIVHYLQLMRADRRISAAVFVDHSPSLADALHVTPPAAISTTSADHLVLSTFPSASHSVTCCLVARHLLPTTLLLFLGPDHWTIAYRHRPLAVFHTLVLLPLTAYGNDRLRSSSVHLPTFR